MSSEETQKENKMSGQVEDSQSGVKFITLMSNDNAIFRVDRRIVKFSNVLNDMLNVLGDDDDDDDEDDQDPIRLAHVTKLDMEKIIEWCSHYVELPLDDEETTRIKDVSDFPEWDKKFFTMDVKALFSLSKAVNFLDIKPMLIMTCKNIAFHMKEEGINDILEMYYKNKKEEVAQKKEKIGKKVLGRLPTMSKIIPNRSQRPLDLNLLPKSKKYFCNSDENRSNLAAASHVPSSFVPASYPHGRNNQPPRYHQPAGNRPSGNRFGYQTTSYGPAGCRRPSTEMNFMQRRFGKMTLRD